jgi:hypothetical protein
MHAEIPRKFIKDAGSQPHLRPTQLESLEDANFKELPGSGPELRHTLGQDPQQEGTADAAKSSPGVEQWDAVPLSMASPWYLSLS